MAFIGTLVFLEQVSTAGKRLVTMAVVSVRDEGTDQEFAPDEAFEVAAPD